MPVCPKCGRTFKAQGMPMHIAACKGKGRVTPTLASATPNSTLVDELLDKMEDRAAELRVAMADLRGKLDTLEREEKVLTRVLAALREGVS